jgi:cytokinesis protein
MSLPGSTPSTAPNSARASFLGVNLGLARKDMPFTPNIKMKQLQWDKLPQQQVSRTIWKDDEPERERGMLEKLKLDGIWNEMEEDFKAKQLVINLMARQKRAELKSVLDPQTKKRVGEFI